MTDRHAFVPAGDLAPLDRYIGYYKPYASSHEELDRAPAAIFAGCSAPEKQYEN